jgi:hypothetical protein
MDQITFISLQILLLLVTLAAWWAARRDLMSLAETQQTPTLEKIEMLRETVEQLLAQLDLKLSEIDERGQSITSAKADAPKRTRDVMLGKHVAPMLQPIEAIVEEEPVKPRSTADSRYEAVYALADSGISLEEIARRTGLGSAEVDMVISLRPVSDEQ